MTFENTVEGLHGVGEEFLNTLFAAGEEADKQPEWCMSGFVITAAALLLSEIVLAFDRPDEMLKDILDATAEFVEEENEVPAGATMQ